MPRRLERVQDPGLLRGLQEDLLVEVLGRAEAQATVRRFLGPRPQVPTPMLRAVHRAQVPELRAREAYMVAEKSDGERILLWALRAAPRLRGADALVLVGRDFGLQAVAGGEELARLLAPAGNTVLDGELVFREPDRSVWEHTRDPDAATRTAVFLAFDAAVESGARVADKPLPARLAAVGRCRVRVKEAEALAARAGRPRPPLHVVGKAMLPVHQIGSVLHSIHLIPRPPDAPLAPGEIPELLGDGHGHAHVRVYRNWPRSNGNDGLVFTPTAPSFVDLALRATTTPERIYKWKPLEDNTVDFSVRCSDLDTVAQTRSPTSAAPIPVPAFLMNAAKTLERVGDAVAFVTPPQAAGILRIARPRNLHDIVLECRVINPSGTDREGEGGSHKELAVAVAQVYRRGHLWQFWRPIRVRAEKSRPNNVDIARDTVSVIAEGLTEEELIALLRSQ
jgi:hypothetical protein